MRILICTPYDLKIPRGNSIASLRLMAGFEKKGHKVLILENCEIKDESAAIAAAFSFKPDIAIVMHAWRCAAVFRGLQRKGSIPIVVSLRGTDINEMIEDENKGSIICSVLTSCQAITVFSDYSRKKVMRYLPESDRKIRVIPNGLDLKDSNVNYRQKLDISGNAFVVVGLAGIRHEKNLAGLIEMLSHVRAKGGELVYLHGGPVLEENEGGLFKDFCREYRWIYYGGVIPHHEVLSFLKAGDIFVSASRSEGMPHAVREAMFARLPCLLSDIEGHRNMVQEGVEGLFFGNEKDFVNKMKVFMNSKNLRETLGTNGCNRVTKELSDAGEINSYLAIAWAAMGHPGSA
jgi:glycosyltransferase involved in cell wall biosynthesis